jgi:hypothetical protein
LPHESGGASPRSSSIPGRFRRHPCRRATTPRSHPAPPQAQQNTASDFDGSVQTTKPLLTRAIPGPVDLHRCRKPQKGALRCLKRYLARRFWRLLTEPPLEPEQAQAPEPKLTADPVEPEPITIPERPAPRREVDRTIIGPIPMVCIT